MERAVNRHNCTYWSAENPHWIYLTHTPYGHKIFKDGNVAGGKYLSMFRDKVVPALPYLHPNAIYMILPNVNRWFQHDGTTPYYAFIVRTYLKTKSPQENRFEGEVILSCLLDCQTLRRSIFSFGLS